MLLRPKTGLKDMIVELDPGHADARPRRRTASRSRSRNTLPDVNLDEILSQLDRDTRDYLQLLVARRRRGPAATTATNLSASFRRFDPPAATWRRSRRCSPSAAQNIAPLDPQLPLLVTSAVGGKDKQLAELVDSSNAVFQAFAEPGRQPAQTLQLLPATLRDDATRRWQGRPARHELGPTLAGLRPGARALGPSLRRRSRSCATTTPVIRDQLRPFAQDATADGQARCARPPRDLATLTPDLDDELQGRSTSSSTRSPTTRRAATRATCSRLAWAQPRRRLGLLDPGRARARSGAACSQSTARRCTGARERRELGQPDAGHADRPAQPADDRARLPETSPGCRGRADG